MNFHDASQDVRAIQEHFTENRDCICQDSIEKAKELCDHWEIRIDRRRRRKKKMPGESGDDAGLSEEVEMVRLMKGTINSLNTEMGERLVRLRNLDNTFGFLLDVKGLLSLVCPEAEEHINSIKQ